MNNHDNIGPVLAAACQRQQLQEVVTFGGAQAAKTLLPRAGGVLSRTGRRLFRTAKTLVRKNPKGRQHLAAVTKRGIAKGGKFVAGGAALGAGVGGGTALATGRSPTEGAAGGAIIGGLSGANPLGAAFAGLTGATASKRRKTRESLTPAESTVVDILLEKTTRATIKKEERRKFKGRSFFIGPELKFGIRVQRRRSFGDTKTELGK